MTQLNCSVIHCMSNRDGCCCRPEIQVGGANATELQQTCCESFRSTREGATNAMDYSHVNKTMPIRCEATNCIYNKDYRCDAKKIQVSGQSAEKMDQTCCETFECESRRK